LALLKARGYPDFEEIDIGHTTKAGWTLYHETWTPGATHDATTWRLTIQLLANGCFYYNSTLITPHQFLSFRPHHPMHRDDPFIGWQLINDGLRNLKARVEAVD
jgi:hypothetical protein